MLSACRSWRQRDALGDVQTEALQLGALRRVVRHQPQALDAEVHQDLRADAVLAHIDRRPNSRFASTVSCPWSWRL